jgi:hypothetical protein
VKTKDERELESLVGTNRVDAVVTTRTSASPDAGVSASDNWSLNFEADCSEMSDPGDPGDGGYRGDPNDEEDYCAAFSCGNDSGGGGGDGGYNDDYI